MSLRPAFAVRAMTVLIAAMAAFLLPPTVPDAAAFAVPFSASVTNPTEGATVSGDVPLTALATQAGQSAFFTLTPGDTSQPPQQITASVGEAPNSWQATWATSGLAPGAYAIVATVNDGGRLAVSQPRNVTVSASGGGAAAPEPFSVAVTVPPAGSTLTGTATLAATTSASATSVQFMLTPSSGGETASVDATGAATTWTATVNSAAVPNGGYNLVARAFHGGAFTDSPAVAVTVTNAEQSQTLNVTLTAPAGGATLSGSATFNATTNVTPSAVTFVVRNDAGAVVATVVATGSGTTWMGGWDTTLAPNGPYTVRAVATKNGTTAMSSIASVTVTNAAAPPAGMTVTLTAPAGGATVQGTVPLAATTSVPSDTVDFVVTKAFGDNQSFTITATGAATAWAAAWNAAEQPNGTYTVVAKATVSGVETLSATTTVTLSNPAAPAAPSAPAAPLVVVTVTSPAAGVTVSGTTTLVAATNIAVNSLAFVLRDPTNQSATPVATVHATPGTGNVSWSVVVNTATVPDGTYAIIARGTKDGAVTPSAPVLVTVANAPAASAEGEAESLTLVITTPALAATLTGPANLSATANLPLDGLTFVITGGAEPVSVAAAGNTTKTVWSAQWDSSSVPNGAYSIRATFVRSGVSAQGAPRAFTVFNATVAVTIASPSSNAELHGTQEVVVSAVPAATSVGVKITNTQDASITSVRNATFDASKQVWVVSVNTRDFKNGTYRLDAKGVGAQGKEFLASPVTVRIANEIAQTPRQFAVRMTAPADGTTAVGVIALAATVDGEAAGVQFFASPDGAGSIVRLDATFDAARRQWIATWRTAGSSNGTYAVGAVAVNAQNAKTESAKIHVRVANPVREEKIEVPLSVRLLEPADGAAEGRVQFVAATEGAVTNVRVFVRVRGGATDAQVLHATFDAARVAWIASWDSSAVPNGTYESVAVARDATGKEASSGIVSLFVERRPPPAPDTGTGETSAPGTPPAPDGGPHVAIVRPVHEARIRGVAVLTATSTGVAKVGFIIRGDDGVSLMNRAAIRAEGAWSLTWNTSTAKDGRYLVDAVGFDQGGQRVATSQIAVHVENAVTRPVERVDVVPTDVVKDAARELPPNTTALPIEQLPPVTDANAKLDAECAQNRIPADKCQRWLASRHGAKDCRSAGILTKEECVSYLRKKAGGEVPECQGRSAEACAEEIAKKTVGMLDADALDKLRDALTPVIGKPYTVRPKAVKDAPTETDEAPADSADDDEIARHMPLVRRTKPVALRVHASPAFATAGGRDSHQSVPAVLFLDSDGDGLPDDVEKRLRTDPMNADTDGDGYADAAEVQAGYNPRGRGVLTDGVALAPIDVAIISGSPIEQPKSAGETDESLKVDDVQAAETSDAEGAISLRGRANPGDVVTVFIYSYLPVVFTTTAEEDGTWSYELESSLSDGEHEAYVTVTDDTGKIKSKSNPLSFFINDAKAVGEDEFFRPEALEETSPLVAAQAQAPVRRFAGMYLGGAALLILIALVIAYFLFLKPKGTPPAA